MFRARRQSTKNRQGAAAVECAFVLPLIFLITAGTIECCSTIFLKESVTLAAHEGARAAIRRRAAASDAVAAVDEILAVRGVDVSTMGTSYVSVSPDPTGADILDPISVTVTAPTSGNTVLPLPNWFTWVANRQVSSTVIMRREFDD